MMLSAAPYWGTSRAARRTLRALPLAVDKDKQAEVYTLLHSLLHGNAQEIVEARKTEVLNAWETA